MTSKHPTLAKAPITEALIDLQVKLPDGTKPELFNSFYDEVKEKYPEQKEQRHAQYEVQPGGKDGPLEPRGTKVVGYQYFSSDKIQVVQARVNGFTFSRLKPYTTWEDLRTETLRLWEIYSKIANPVSITRAAVRFINNLQIPMPISDFGDYLVSPPTIPQALPQSLSSFLTRNVIYMPNHNFHIIVTQALENIISDSKPAPVILDIDAFHLTPDGISDKQAWEALEHLRHIKNDVFFESITTKLRRLYE